MPCCGMGNATGARASRRSSPKSIPISTLGNPSPGFADRQRTRFCSIGAHCSPATIRNAPTSCASEPVDCAPPCGYSGSPGLFSLLEAGSASLNNLCRNHTNMIRALIQNELHGSTPSSEWGCVKKFYTYRGLPVQRSSSIRATGSSFRFCCAIWCQGPARGTGILAGSGRWARPTTAGPQPA